MAEDNNAAITPSDIEAVKTPPAEEPKEIRLSNEAGDVYVGQTYEEVAKKAVEGKAEASRTIERLKAQLAEQQASPPPAPPTKGDGFNNDEYFRLMAADPIKAQDYLDEHRFGPQFSDRIQNVFHETSQNQAQRVANVFLSNNPDFPSTPEANKELMDYAERLAGPQQTYDPIVLEAAWGRIKREGRVTPTTVDEPQSRGAAAPPMPATTGTGEPEPDVMAALDGLTNDELLRLLEQKGMK